MRLEKLQLRKVLILTATSGLLLFGQQQAAHSAKKEDNLDFNNEQELKLKDTSEDDAQFEKELELKLDDDSKKEAKAEPKNSSKEEVKNEAKPEAIPPADSTAIDDAGFDAFEEPKQQKVTKPEPEPEALKTESPPPSLEAETSVAPMAPASDEPDLQYEAKLHDIYANFYSSKTPDTEWQTLVGTHASERYQIHKGDNLWNISKTLFGDGNYWPKVWALNSKLTNPHLVTTNNQIRFMLGDESGPPVFTVTENATANVQTNVQANAQTNIEAEAQGNVKAEGQIAKQAPTEEASDNAEPDIPPPLKISRPVLKRLPPSLPEWQDTSASGKYDELGIDYAHRKILEIKDQIPLVGYISEKIPEPLGVVREVEVGNNMASAFQYIYVVMKKGQGQVGETYLAVASRGEVQSVHSSISGFLGYSIEVQGEVQLVERVGAKAQVDGEMFRALVLRIISPVSTEAILIPGKIENTAVTEKGPRSQVVAQIIGGSYFNRRQVYGNQSIAFLNRGELDGLEEGQILPIRANRAVRLADTEVTENVRPIGWIRLIKTTPHFATGLVVRVWSDVLTGDLTGSGELLPRANKRGSVVDAPKTASSKKLIQELDEDEDLGAPPANLPMNKPDGESEKAQPSEQNDGGSKGEPVLKFDEDDSGF